MLIGKAVYKDTIMLSALPYFKALADETRLRLLYILHRHELSVNELVGILGMGQSRVSRHLKILTEAGLLQWRRDGLWVFYSAAGSGSGQSFIQSIMPFMENDAALESDAIMAAHCIDERVQKTRQFFNAIADDWDELNRKVLGDFDLGMAVCQALPKPCSLAVDLGCGTGIVLEKLLPFVSGVVGVDGSPRMLELARRRFASAKNPDTVASVSLRIGELNHLPLRDAEADFACINLVLHHLSNPVDTLREVQRILRPQGILFIADFVKHNNEKMRDDFGDRWLGFSDAMLTQFLQEAGLALQSVRHESVGNDLGLFLAVVKKI